MKNFDDPYEIVNEGISDGFWTFDNAPDPDAKQERKPWPFTPAKNNFPLGVERMSEAQRSSPSAPGGTPNHK